MVTVIERQTTTDAREHSGFLGERVEQDMADMLSGYSGAAETCKTAATRTAFAHGIPMAGVRYYGFVPEK